MAANIEKFDLVIASEVVEHLDDRVLFFKETSKLLKNKILQAKNIKLVV